MELIQEVVNCKVRNVKVSYGWWESFRKRHPTITLCTASPFRIVGSDPSIIARYFVLRDGGHVTEFLLVVIQGYYKNKAW